MKLVFYREKSTGKLTGVFTALRWSDEELNKRVSDFNANESNFVTAEIVEADEHMEFLFRKSEEKKFLLKNIA